MTAYSSYAGYAGESTGLGPYSQTYRQPQTFAQMQMAGYARPPAPVNGPTTARTANPTQSGPTPILPPPGSSFTPGSQANTPAPQPYSGQPYQNGSPFNGALTQKLLDLIGNPSRFGADQAEQTFDRLNKRLSQNYDLQRSDIKSEMARRGLLSSTVYGGKLGDLATNQAQAQSDLASSIAQAQADTYGQDLARAIQAAMGYEQQGFGQQLSTAQFNQNAQNQQLAQYLSLLGYL